MKKSPVAFMIYWFRMCIAVKLIDLTVLIMPKGPHKESFDDSLFQWLMESEYQDDLIELENK